MFSTATAPSTTSVASTALRSAGLIDRDERMKDATERPGGRKGTSKIRSHKTRLVDTVLSKEQPAASSSRMHAARSNPLSIRGAAERPTAAGRLRRNAISSTTTTSTGDSRPIKSTSGGSHRVPVRSLDVWRDFVNARWNPEARFLNLESMAEDELLKKHRMSPPGSGGSPKEAAVIFKMASQLKPDVQTISLANNHLTGPMLTAISRYLPRLANLSLANNKIRSWKELESIASKKGRLEYLRELILIGNPLREEEIKHGRLDRYRTEVTRKFSSLEILDSEPVTQIAFDVPQSTAPSSAITKPSSTTFPIEMQPSFITGVDGAMVSNFLMRFFTTFDTQRSLLVNAYHPSATFSYSVNTSIPARARLAGLHTSRNLPNQRRLDWTSWISGGEGGSRNLSRGNHVLDKQFKSLHVGGEQTVKSILALPGTKHDIGGPSEKFSVDSFPVPHGDAIGLLLVVHGEFVEVGPDGVRSFDRSFILAPAPEGSVAKTNGWDVVILSDQWVIRHYSSCEAWAPGPMKVQASPPNPGAISQQASLTLPPDQEVLLATIPEFQRPLVIEICQRTSLNVKFAVDCLTGNQWDVERAVANFNEVKGTLGRDAFL